MSRIGMIPVGLVVECVNGVWHWSPLLHRQASEIAALRARAEGAEAEVARLAAELAQAQADARRLLGELYVADEVNLFRNLLDVCGVEDQRTALGVLDDALDRYDLPGLGVVVRRVLAMGGGGSSCRA
jgi:hypothetical protein